MLTYDCLYIKEVLCYTCSRAHRKITFTRYTWLGDTALELVYKKSTYIGLALCTLHNLSNLSKIAGTTVNLLPAVIAN